MSRIIRLNQVKEKTGLSRSAIYLLSKGGKFPKSVNLGLRAVGWLESDINAWIDEKFSSKQGGANE